MGQYNYPLASSCAAVRVGLGWWCHFSWFLCALAHAVPDCGCATFRYLLVVLCPSTIVAFVFVRAFNLYYHGELLE